MRANSSAEKLTCMPKKSMPGYSLLASANVGPHKCIISRFAKTPRTGLPLQRLAGGGNKGVGRYVGNRLRGTWTVSRTPSRTATAGRVVERRLSRRRLCIASALRTSGHKHRIASRSKREVIFAHTSQLARWSVHGPFKPNGTACSVPSGASRSPPVDALTDLATLQRDVIINHTLHGLDRIPTRMS